MFGKLKWEFSELECTTNFLDVTITLKPQLIGTTIFEKALNKYLYLPPHSAHPPGVLKSLIAGAIYRVNQLCINTPDELATLLEKFKQCLVAQG